VRSRELTKRAVVLAALAAGLGRLVATDAYLAYVKPGMRIPLILSVAVLAVLAISSANAADDPGDEGHGAGHGHGDHDHDHSRFPRIGWWMLAPVVCIALVPLVPLGAEAVEDRQANAVSERRSRSGSADEADRVTGGEVTMLDFVDRTVNDPTNPYTDPVTLTGFVSPEPVDASVGAGFVLSRFVMSCCAADALPLSVFARTEEAPPDPGTWVTVTGTHVPPPDNLPDGDRPLTENIVLEAETITEIDQPSRPYEAY
jgi:uncharacterized repeat protein (TIGR03943 family)